MYKEKFMLPNGVDIPKLGLGTWLIKDKDVESTVLNAVHIGYRHFDTAKVYGNERGVGKGIRMSNISRDELFITNKISGNVKTYKSAKKAIDHALHTMGLDYIDLMLIHAPKPDFSFRSKENRYFKENINVWRALEEAYQAGKVKAIGVSNFHIEDLDNIIQNCEIKPMVNQLLTHIGNVQFETIEYCQKNDILVEGYSPIAHGFALSQPAIKAMAEKYEVSVAQLCIRFVLQLGIVALPKTSNVKHMESNLDVDFIISDEDMNELKTIEKMNSYGKFKLFQYFVANKHY